MSAARHDADQVRLATVDDIPALSGLFVEMVRYYGDPPCDEAAVAQALRRHVFAPESGIEMLVAADGGSLQGFATLSKLFPQDGIEAALYMKDIFIAADARRTGVGRALIAAAASQAKRRGCARLLWAAAGDNAPALALYESVGARQVSGARYFKLDATAMDTLLRASARAEDDI